jgi:hypothetical protein
LFALLSSVLMVTGSNISPGLLLVIISSVTLLCWIGLDTNASNDMTIAAAANGELPDGYIIDYDAQPETGLWVYTTRSNQDLVYV